MKNYFILCAIVTFAGALHGMMTKGEQAVLDIFSKNRVVNSDERLQGFGYSKINPEDLKALHGLSPEEVKALLASLKK